MSIKIMNIYKESFHDVRHHMLEWARVAYAPALIWALGAAFMGIMYWSAGQSLELHHAMMGQTISSNKAGEAWFLVGFGNFIYFVTYIVSIMILYINGFRYGVLHEGGNQWWNLHLNKRVVKIALYSLLVGALAGIYVLVSAGIILVAQHLFESLALNIILGIFLTLFGLYALIRISLVQLLVAIDRSQPIRTSWTLLKRNVLRLLGLFFLVMVSILIIGIVGIAILALLGLLFAFISPILAAPIAILIYLFGIYVWFLNWAVTSKALSLVYTSLTEETAA